VPFPRRALAGPYECAVLFVKILKPRDVFLPRPPPCCKIVPLVHTGSAGVLQPSAPPRPVPGARTRRMRVRISFGPQLASKLAFAPGLAILKAPGFCRRFTPVSFYRVLPNPRFALCPIHRQPQGLVGPFPEARHFLRVLPCIVLGVGARRFTRILPTSHRFYFGGGLGKQVLPGRHIFSKSGRGKSRRGRRPRSASPPCLHVPISMARGNMQEECRGFSPA
jgi:hypothetical protein